MSKGHENLVPLNKRTKDEQRKIAADGGVASGESRRKRKALKETMETLLSLPIADRRHFDKASGLGFDKDEIDNSTLVIVALWGKAISGDVAAIKELRDLIDETNGDAGQIEALMREILGDEDV